MRQLDWLLDLKICWLLMERRSLTEKLTDYYDEKKIFWSLPEWESDCRSGLRSEGPSSLFDLSTREKFQLPSKGRTEYLKWKLLKYAIKGKAVWANDSLIENYISFSALKVFR